MLHYNITFSLPQISFVWLLNFVAKIGESVCSQGRSEKHFLLPVKCRPGGSVTATRTVRMGVMKLPVRNPQSWGRSVMSLRRFSVNLTGNVSVGRSVVLHHSLFY